MLTRYRNAATKMLRLGKIKMAMQSATIVLIIEGALIVARSDLVHIVIDNV